MIVTDCKSCCFSDKNYCKLGQLTCINDNRLIALGYCRAYRSQKWFKRQSTQDLNELLQIIKKTKFHCDLLIFFDEYLNNHTHLKYSIDKDLHNILNCFNKIIIVDVTKSKYNTKSSLLYMKNLPKDIRANISVEKFLDNDIVCDKFRVIRQVVMKTKSPFFAVIKAGQQIDGINNVRCYIDDLKAKFMCLKFSAASTIEGLYVREPYLVLSRVDFIQALTDEEVNSPIKLCEIDEIVDDMIYNYGN